MPETSINDYLKYITHKYKYPLTYVPGLVVSTDPFEYSSYVVGSTYNPFDPFKSKEFDIVSIVQPTYDNPYSQKIIVGAYPSIDGNESVIKTIVKYYYLKITNKWLYNNLKSLLNFIEINNGKPEIVSSMQKYNEAHKKYEHDSEPIDEIDTKINYLEDLIISRRMVKHVLSELVDSNSDIHWYNLKNFEDKIKHVFYNYIKKKMIDAIEGN